MSAYSTRLLIAVGQFNLRQQPPWMDAERLCKIVQTQKGEVDAAILDLAEIGLGKAGCLTQRFLLHRPRSSELGHILPDQLPDIHADVVDDPARGVYSLERI